MMTRLEILLEQIDAQMEAIEQQFVQDRFTTVNDYLNSAKNVYDEPSIDPFTIRSADGSYPLVPLLAAKAQVLHAMVMLQMRDIS